MTGKLIGYYRSYGTFKPDDKPEGVPFDNIVLQFLSELPNSKKDLTAIEGQRKKFTELKMKLKYFPEKFGGNIGRVSELDDLINHDFEWSFNEYGNVERVDPI